MHETCKSLIARTYNTFNSVHILCLTNYSLEMPLSFLPSAGQDYEQVNTTIVLSPSVSQQCITLIILDDMNVENYEDFTIKLSSSDQAVQFSDNTTLVYIAQDDDSEYQAH